jgi:rhodanese-related sulfurtransferase
MVGLMTHPTAVGEIKPSELDARRKAGTGPLVLDVREGWELDVARIPDVLHIPMNEIPARLGELDADREIVVMCRSGGRSMQVAQFLARNGFRSVANLTGGILAWSQDVDPSVRPY